MTSLREIEEVNVVLRDPVEMPDFFSSNRILVGSGEDCQVVLFAQSYKRITENEREDG